MTTFAFANVAANFSGSTTLSHGEQTIYTVGSGKLAKIKFDSFHVSVSSTGNNMSKCYWALYSQDSSSTAVRKHMVGQGVSDGSSDVRTFAFYNPSDYRQDQPIFNSTSGNERYYFTMNALPEDFVSNNQVQDFNDSMRNYQLNNSGYGTTVYGPETFFMAAGEVLKLRTITVCNGSLTRYTNMRCAVYLEDS